VTFSRRRAADAHRSLVRHAFVTRAAHDGGMSSLETMGVVAFVFVLVAFVHRLTA